MKTIKFTDILSKMILNGEKTTTWRLFDDKNLRTVDHVEFVNKSTMEKFGEADLISVVEKDMRKLNDDDAEGHEHIDSLEEIYKRYDGYYPNKNIGPDTKIKIIKFIFIKD